MQRNQETQPILIVDAHEDVAWGALSLGRDVSRSALETRHLEIESGVTHNAGQCMLGLPEWLAGNVALVFGTLFVAPARQAPGPWNGQTYHNAAEAHQLAVAQLDFYRRLADVEPRVSLVSDAASLDAVLASWNREQRQPEVGIVLLMEGADPVREPAELEWWYERGLRLVGPTWASGSRYAGGNHAPGPLTDAGRELLEAMADLGIVLDVSHLAEEALVEAVERYPGAIAATHAPPRIFVDSPRLLGDDALRRLVRRDAVIGVTPYNPFLRPGWKRADGKEAATIAHVIAAIDHVCQVAGDARHVGLGSDFDGGFGAESAPAGFDTVADLARVGPALSERGFDDGDVAAILGGNWLRLLRSAWSG